jgi:transcriptional antiterminator RfaH
MAKSDGKLMGCHLEDSEAKWYCVRSQPRHEHIAAANLRRHRRLDVFHPRIRFRRPTRRGPVWVTEPLFPNYLLVRFPWHTMLADVQHTFGVAGVVRFGLFCPTIPPEVIEELQAAVGEDETRVVEQTLEIGDEVQIAGGAFDGFRAIVTRVMPARQRVAVLLDFLGKQAVVEVDCNIVITDTVLSNVRGGSVVAARLALR